MSQKNEYIINFQFSETQKTLLENWQLFEKHQPMSVLFKPSRLQNMTKPTQKQSFLELLEDSQPTNESKTAKISFWSQKYTSQKVFCQIDLCSKLLQNLKNLSPKTWVNWVLFSGWNQKFSFFCSRHITRILRCTARGCLEFKLFSQHGAVEKRKKRYQSLL